MSDPLADQAQDGETVIPVHVLAAGSHAAAVAALGPLAEALASAQSFSAKPGQVLAVLGEDGAPVRLLAGVGALEGPAAALALRGMSDASPTGLYVLADAPDGFDHALGALAFSLGARVFGRYKSEPARTGARLLVSDPALRGRLQRIAEACALVRDMVDVPANDMGPREIEAIARDIARAHGATVEVVVGDALLEENYPALHAVGGRRSPTARHG